MEEEAGFYFGVDNLALTNIPEFCKLATGMKMILANNFTLFFLLAALFFGAMSFSLSRVLYRINN